jgi:hypothetical protein
VEHGRQVLYVELYKALYGTLKAALLFWKQLLSQLLKWGGLHPQPLQRLRNEQDYQWQVMHHSLAC